MMRDRHAALPLGLGGEGGAVAGVAHRGGGDDRQVIDTERPRQRDKALQIGVGELDAVAVQPAGRGDAAPERAHDLFVEQRHQRRAEPLEDDEAQRVRADIDDAMRPSGPGMLRSGIGAGYRASPRDEPRLTRAAAPCRVRTSSDWS